MPVLPSKVYRMLAAQRAGVPLKPTAAAPGAPAARREVRRDPNRPATVKPKKAAGQPSPRWSTW